MKKARNSDPNGQEVTWYEDGVQRVIVVESGHELPADVPASVRDGLLQQDKWTEVDRKAKGD